MTRRYCELADTDVKRAHITASPVDNLDLQRITWVPSKIGRQGQLNQTSPRR